MTVYINQLAREWISAKVPGATAKMPFNQLKREYYISVVGKVSPGTTLPELERRWLAAYITNKGGTPTPGGDLPVSWTDIVIQIGVVPSKYVNQNKILFYLNALQNEPSISPSASLSPSASASPSA